MVIWFRLQGCLLRRRPFLCRIDMIKTPSFKLEVLSMPVWRYRSDFVFIRDSFYLQRRGIAREFVAY